MVTMFLTPLITLLLGLQGSGASPSVTQSPTSKSAGLGETVSLSCTASRGVDDDLSWYLQKAGQPPKLLFRKISTRESDTPSHLSSSGSEPEFTLTINGVQAGDAGVYYCMGVYLVNDAPVWTFGGGTKLIINSGPMVRPSVSLLPPSSEQLSGGSATLACVLSGYSPQGAVVSWQVDGTEVTEGVLSSSEEEKSGRYSSSSTLSLSKERWMEGELYSCSVLHHDHSQSQSLHRSQCQG